MPDANLKLADSTMVARHSFGLISRAARKILCLACNST